MHYIVDPLSLIFVDLGLSSSSSIYEVNTNAGENWALEGMCVCM